VVSRIRSRVAHAITAANLPTYATDSWAQAHRRICRSRASPIAGLPSVRFLQRRIRIAVRSANRPACRRKPALVGRIEAEGVIRHLGQSHRGIAVRNLHSPMCASDDSSTYGAGYPCLRCSRCGGLRLRLQSALRATRFLGLAPIRLIQHE